MIDSIYEQEIYDFSSFSSIVYDVFDDILSKFVNWLSS